jgi:hypothetical protein
MVNICQKVLTMNVSEARRGSVASVYKSTLLKYWMSYIDLFSLGILSHLRLSPINTLFASGFQCKSVVYLSHLLCLLQAPTERRGNKPALHSERPGFKYLPGDILIRSIIS